VGLFGGSFEGKKLEKGRATFKNVSPQEEDQIWSNERILFEIEREVIEKYIADTVANEFLRNPNPDKESVWKKIEGEIRNTYIKTEEIDTKLIERVKNREFAEITPSKGTIVFLWLLLIVGVFAEILILVLLAVFGGAGFNFVIIIHGVLLAIGGGFLGYALGKIMIHYEFAKRGELTKDNRLHPIKVSLSAILGFLIIAFIALVRSFGAETPREKFTVIGITVLLGFSVALIEGFRGYYSKLRNHFLKQQERGLQQIATKLHSEMLDSYRITFEKVWEENVKKKFGENKENPQEVKG